MKKNISPSSFDSTMPVRGSLPKERIQQWRNSDKTKAAHERLLAPYRKRGTIVCSDSAGLSRLTKEKPLIEVLKLISEPKEVIHACGKAIGGEAIGTWIADNTVMFYPEDIPVSEVVSQMIAAQKKIADLSVSVGIGIHHGDVYQIDNSLYGLDFESIEHRTETDSNGGDILISETVLEHIEDLSLDVETYLDVFQLQYSQVDIQAILGEERIYPAPFDREFQDRLQRSVTRDDIQELQRNYPLVEKAVALIFFEPNRDDYVLERLSQQLYVSELVKNGISQYDVELVKTDGRLTLVCSSNTEQLLHCMKELHQTLYTEGFGVNIGVSQGPVLLFQLENGRDIAGEPVNWASKLAEDSGASLTLLCDATVASIAKKQEIIEPFSFVLSGQSLEGVKLRISEVLSNEGS